MPKDVYYLKHDANAHNDPKIKAMRKFYGWEGFGWYWLIVALMRSENNYKLEYNDLVFDSLADDMNCDSTKAKSFINDCIDKFKLFSKNGEYFYSDRLVRDMQQYESVKIQKHIAGKISGVIRNTRSTDVQQMFNTRSTDDEHTLNTSSTHVKGGKKMLDKAKNEQPLNTRSTSVELGKEIDNSKLKNIEEINKEENIYKIYESNIGILTPFIAEELKDIETHYPKGWFGEAVKEACNHNARSLRYITAILENWKVRGFKALRKTQETKPSKYGDGWR